MDSFIVLLNVLIRGEALQFFFWDFHNVLDMLQNGGDSYVYCWVFKRYNPLLAPRVNIIPRFCKSFIVCHENYTDFPYFQTIEHFSTSEFP